jgi:hypothetical protein
MQKSASRVAMFMMSRRLMLERPPALLPEPHWNSDRGISNLK